MLFLLLFVINILPSSFLNGKPPFKLVYKHLPLFDIIRVLGCFSFAVKLNKSDKLSEWLEKCVLIGYSNEKRVIS